MPIGAADLEALIEVLEIPTSSVWRVVGAAGSARQVVVQAQPGETVQFVVQVQGQ